MHCCSLYLAENFYAFFRLDLHMISCAIREREGCVFPEKSQSFKVLATPWCNDEKFDLPQGKDNFMHLKPCFVLWIQAFFYKYL